MKSHRQITAAVRASGLTDVYAGFMAAALQIESHTDEEGNWISCLEDACPEGPTRAARLLVLEMVVGFHEECVEYGIWDAVTDQLSERQIGTDLYLTGNGHGSGFWDRPWLPSKLGQTLTERAREAGGVYGYRTTGGRAEICHA